MLARFSVAVVTALSLAACSGSDRATTIDSDSGQESDVASTAELESALLRIEDLPTGWTTPPPAESPSPEPVDEEEISGICNETVIDTDQVPAFAEAEFSKGGELDNQLIQLIVSYAGSREAEAAFEDIQQRAQECSTWEDNDAESEATYSMRALSFPRLGDETMALRMSGEITSLPDPNEEFSFDFSATVEADLIVVQEGNLVMIVSQIAVGFLGPASLDSAETEEITRAAVARLQEV